MSEYKKRFDYWKYETKVLNKLSKLTVLIVDNEHLGLPVSEYIEKLTTVGGKNKKYQLELLDRRIDKIHKEIKEVKNAIK